MGRRASSSQDDPNDGEGAEQLLWRLVAGSMQNSEEGAKQTEVCQMNGTAPSLHKDPSSKEDAR